MFQWKGIHFLDVRETNDDAFSAQFSNFQSEIIVDEECAIVLHECLLCFFNNNNKKKTASFYLDIGKSQYSIVTVWSLFSCILRRKFKIHFQSGSKRQQRRLLYVSLKHNSQVCGNYYRTYNNCNQGFAWNCTYEPEYFRKCLLILFYFCGKYQ